MLQKDIRFVRKEIAKTALPLFSMWEYKCKLSGDEAIVLYYSEFERISQREICEKLNISGIYPERRIRRIYERAITKVCEWNNFQKNK